MTHDSWEIRGEPRELDSLPMLELGEYRERVATTPPPTDRQIEDFADFVVGSRSWYKHLPLLPPGEEFTFFVDPLAGLDRIVGRDGETEYMHRTIDTPKYHYSWMTTVEYRARFCCLSYATTAVTSFYWPVSVRLNDTRDFDGFMANNLSRASIHMEGGYRLPPEIMEGGTVRLTAAIHELAARAVIWQKFWKDGPERWEWPEESGGVAVLRKIIARCRSILADENSPEGILSSGNIDGELFTLTEPERLRQRNEMIRAINRVVALLYG